MISDNKNRLDLDEIIKEAIFQAGFDSFHDYLGTTVSFLEDERRKHNTVIDEISKKIESGEIEIPEDTYQMPSAYEYASDRLTSIDDFENTLFSSFFVTIYSYLESELLSYCRNLEKQNPEKLLLSDIVGKGVQKAITYLVKVQHIGFSTNNNTLWTEIQNYNILRNCIVHNQGRLNDDFEKGQREKLRKFIQRQNSNIELANSWCILSKAFCFEALDTTKDFLHSVIFAEVNLER